MGVGLQDAVVEQKVHAPIEVQRTTEEQLQEQRQLQQQDQRQDQRQQEAGGQQQIYGNLFRHFQPLPAGTPVAPVPAPQASLSYKERRQLKAQQKKELEQNWNEYKGLANAKGLLKSKDVKSLPLFSSQKGKEKWASAKLKHSKLTMGQTAEMVKNGDYSNFENLDGVMRNLVAGKALKQLMQKYNVMETPVDQLCKQIKGEREGVTALLDPALRLGLSLAQRTEGFSDELKARFLALDEAMSAEVMVETLTHQASQEAVLQDIRSKQPKLKESQAQDAAQRAIAATSAQQIQIAKRLMLMHLGRLQKLTPNASGGTDSQEWDKPVAVALSHCSRVALTMPKMNTGSEMERIAHRSMWRDIFYQKDGSNPAQDNSRASSTHSIQRREVNGSDTKEKKLPFNLIGQRGMNVAIGGLGNSGISGKTLSNDGSCGHFYSMYKEADQTHYGAILMGLESDCAGVTNQMGHTHDIKATAEKASSLGGQRTDEVGQKYGGRVCDLSRLGPVEISRQMTRLEDAMKYWQGQPEGMSCAAAEQVMRLLSGPIMSREVYERDVVEVLERHADMYRHQAGGNR